MRSLSLPLKILTHQRPKQRTAGEPVSGGKGGHPAVDDHLTHASRDAEQTREKVRRLHFVCARYCETREDSTKKYHELSMDLVYSRGSVWVGGFAESLPSQSWRVENENPN